MGLLIDGSAVCDRCALPLEGYGVLSGLVCVDLAGAETNQRIYCYVNGCRDAVLTGLVVSPSYDRRVCTTCGVEVPGGILDAMLCVDLDPAAEGSTRNMAFCHVNGHRDALINTTAEVVGGE